MNYFFNLFVRQKSRPISDDTVIFWASCSGQFKLAHQFWFSYPPPGAGGSSSSKYLRLEILGVVSCGHLLSFHFYSDFSFSFSGSYLLKVLLQKNSIENQTKIFNLLFILYTWTFNANAYIQRKKE